MEVAGIEESVAAASPLLGKTVAVVHAAWHSCGSYQVNAAQLTAYKALGARVISIAMMDDLSPPAPKGGRWPGYLAASKDLPADRRFFTATSHRSLVSSGLLREGWLPLIHGDQARWLIEIAKRVPVPQGLETERIDLIHANHYFTLPLALRLGGERNIPVILETQDIQARQYALRNRGGFFLRPYASYDQMLALELGWTARADLCVHLNEEEFLEFGRLLPQARHALVYPATEPAPLSRGRDIVIVASDNYGNYLSLRWFLEEVLPLAGDVELAIYGNIDKGVKNRDAALYEAHKALFMGRVDDIGAVYAATGCILLPTTEGHGLSIKAVEALSSGALLIATPQAFRGMGVDPGSLSNVILRQDAAGFAQALLDIRARLLSGALQPPGADSDTKRLYDRAFSPQAYAKALARCAVPLVAEAASASTPP
ncbi:glycosyltransferase [Methylocystis heyeri]|uniref:glycosyltransferase n=1 Tax=Methylocystis heyeri TaxID=391905 RepID=UPI001FE7040A|nr:glycosyltransferase [Methylocystis heyeri]